ncbi:MAG: hypothetical protein E6R03_17940 [Hyphomicrobiaceae bacterium]|nr:MAG: hypothetical protein E6R03_17940 [Hyphomicrobiaceae bacterium]
MYYSKKTKLEKLKQMFPLNSEGVVLTTTHRKDWIPLGYRDENALEFTIENHGPENEFFLDESGLSVVTTVLGRSAWIQIPLDEIYMAITSGEAACFDYTNTLPTPVSVDAEPSVH